MGCSDLSVETSGGCRLSATSPRTVMVGVRSRRAKQRVLHPDRHVANLVTREPCSPAAAHCGEVGEPLIQTDVAAARGRSPGMARSIFPNSGDGDPFSEVNAAAGRRTGSLSARPQPVLIEAETITAPREPQSVLTVRISGLHRSTDLTCSAMSSKSVRIGPHHPPRPDRRIRAKDQLSDARTRASGARPLATASRSRRLSASRHPARRWSPPVWQERSGNWAIAVWGARARPADIAGDNLRLRLPLQPVLNFASRRWSG